MDAPRAVVIGMSPRCIVSDLDRTLTGPDLLLDGAALERIRALRERGVLVVIATGRRFDELEARGLTREVDGLVAENGAVICIPSVNVFQVVAPEFVRLARKALGPLEERFSWGRAIGSGPRELVFPASERLAAARVGHTLEFNAEEVMLLPPRVSKATGAELCLQRLGASARDAWAIGDGENDAALLKWARVGAAPANAAPEALTAADVRLARSYSDGFLELTEPLVTVAAPR